MPISNGLTDEQILQSFEPEGHGAEFVRAALRAAYELATILQGTEGISDTLPGRLDHLEERITQLERRLKDHVRVMGSLLEALQRLPAD